MNFKPTSRIIQANSREERLLKLALEYALMAHQEFPGRENHLKRVSWIIEKMHSATAAIMTLSDQEDLAARADDKATITLEKSRVIEAD